MNKCKKKKQDSKSLEQASLRLRHCCKKSIKESTTKNSFQARVVKAFSLKLLSSIALPELV